LTVRAGVTVGGVRVLVLFKSSTGVRVFGVRTIEVGFKLALLLLFGLLKPIGRAFMKTQIYLTGISIIPKQLKKDAEFQCQLVENPYDLRLSLGQTSGEKIIVVYLPFLETRHFDIYAYLQKTYANVKTFFVVEELSFAMKSRLKTFQDFVVLWKTEELHLARDIKSYLSGKKLELRQDRRDTIEKGALLTPSMLPPGMENKAFQPILGGKFDNISTNGSCVKIRAPFYNKKDFVSVTYQNKEGDYVAVEGQVRWTKWNESEQSQEIGLQFLTQS
jgi:hypothetical protein